MVPLPPLRACDTQDEGAGSAKGLSFPDALRFRLQGHITEPPVLYSRVLAQDSVTASVSVSFIRAHNPGLVLPTYHYSLMRKGKGKDYYDWQT